MDQRQGKQIINKETDITAIILCPLKKKRDRTWEVKDKSTSKNKTMR